ncbi:MAG: HlyD family efflux transporter periplasmic adaptor subunit [Notoacmeibacter sp.]|nr:HlyD family efflux transporter periplasmic adaptor subunit [Notoacmeibacter sp.]
MAGLLCSLPLLSGFLAACGGSAPLASGYMEGDFVLVAPVETARLESLDVRRGSRVEKGAVLGAMERRDAELELARTRAALAQSQNQLADLKIGKRAEEIAVLEAALNSARVQAGERGRTVQRLADLARRGTIAQSAYDDAVSARDVANAAVAQAEANLSVARLPARPGQIEAAEAAVAQARSAVEAAEWRLGQRVLVAPAAGSVTDIIRNPGELAGPQAPVLSLLPDGAVKLRVYLGEPDMARVHLGTKLVLTCDGCAGAMKAEVSYVAREPEFTPPVIYSLENRQKLVFLVEARPDAAAASLKPGQIVDVFLVEPGE